jgi:glycosyltransferase involved in cell wall biosynthesis
MIGNKTISVILPAYNAEKTLQRTYAEIPLDLVDHVILVDDDSTDKTYQIAQELNIEHVIRHDHNIGYGGNQKTCYQKALSIGSDIIVMLHPDYQYTPKLIPAMCHLIYSGVYKVVLGSRILGKGAREGGMPLYKYILNRILTFIQNIMLNQKLSEYHTGYRAFDAEVLRNIHFKANSNHFVFDNQVIAQVIHAGYKIGEISCPTNYFKEASSIRFWKGLQYGLGVLWVSMAFCLQKTGLCSFSIFKKSQ